MFWNKIHLSDWRSPTVLLFLYGLLKEFRPSEPYVTVFFTEIKNFTEQEVTETIYPVSTYSALGLTVLIFLTTDALLYRPIIILQAIAGIVVAVVLVVGEGLPSMLASQFLYGLFLSCEVAYLTYLYASVPIEQYPRVSALCRVAYLLGRFLSGVVGQAFVSTNLLNYLELFYFTFVTLSLSFIVSLALPWPKQSLYFHRNSHHGDPNAPKIPKHIQVFNHLKEDLRAAYIQPYVLAWSAWWAISTGISFQAITYLQVLWLAQTSDAEDQRWNGYVEAVYTILGSGASWLSSRILFRHSPQWKAWGSIAIVALMFGGFLWAALLFHNIFIEYLFYVLYGALYQSAMTVASSEIAQNISNDSTALIFGVNSFMALFLQGFLTTVITSKHGLRISIQSQFIVYASICGVTGVVFVIFAFVSYFKFKPKPVVENTEFTMQNTSQVNIIEKF